MKNKSVLWLLEVGLLILVLGLAACGSKSEPGDGIITIPHDTGFGFENCLVCHTGGDHPMPDNHAGYTIDLCLSCHPISGPTPTTKPPTTTPATTTPATTTPATTTPATTTPATTTPATTTPTTTAPAASMLPADHSGYTVNLCMACHGPTGVKPNPADHADYPDDSCFDCHEKP